MKNINEILKKIRKQIPEISLIHFSEIMDILFKYGSEGDKAQDDNCK